jgi:hypothetical protein
VCVVLKGILFLLQDKVSCFWVCVCGVLGSLVVCLPVDL